MAAFSGLQGFKFGGPARGGGGAAAPASGVTSLEIMGATPLLDATNDYSDATSRIGINGDGWIAKLVLPDDGVSTLDPTKIVLTVSDPGYDASGSTTVTRTITGTIVVRRQYNAASSKQNAASAGVRTAYYALDDDIYDATTIVLATSSVGLYGGVAAGVIGSVTNSSTLAYEKPQFGWLNLQQERATGAFSVEGIATHRRMRNGRQVARIEYIGKDHLGNVAATQTASTTSLSAFQTQGQIVDCYPATIPVTGLTQASVSTDIATVNAKVYPWIGDSTAVLDLEVDGVAWPTANPQTPLRFMVDKNGTYGGAHVAVQVGAAGGTVQATYALALTTPYPSVEAAINALDNYNNANKGHNDHSGSDVWLMETTPGAGASHTVGGVTNATPAGGCWTTIQVDPAATGAVKVIFAVTRSMCSLLRWRVNIDHTAQNGFDGGASVNYSMSALDGLTLTPSGGTVPITYRFGLNYIRNLTISGAGVAGTTPGGVAGGAYRMSFPLMLGCLGESLSTGGQTFIPFVMAGCSWRRCTFIHNAFTTVPFCDSQDGQILLGNQFRDTRATCSMANTEDIVRGIGLVQNVIERAVSTLASALSLGGDSMVRPMRWVVMAYNTIPGVDSTGRANQAYFDTAATAGLIKRINRSYNLLYQGNTKSDTFDQPTQGTGRTGNWPNRHFVGERGNVMIVADAQAGTGGNPLGTNWTGDYMHPSNQVVASVTFTDNKSGVAGAGFGDYSLTGATNDAYNRVPSGFAGLAHDLAGVARLNDGTGAAGAFERTV